MKAETKFRAYTVRPNLLKLNNCAFFPIQQQSIRGDADFILCINGFFIWLELKTDDGITDALQEFKASQVKAANGVTLVARPYNWKSVYAFLKLLDEGIYDKNVLRAIKQAPIPTSSPEVKQPAPKRHAGVQDQAYCDEPAKKLGRDERGF